MNNFQHIEKNKVIVSTDVIDNGDGTITTTTHYSTTWSEDVVTNVAEVRARAQKVIDDTDALVAKAMPVSKVQTSEAQLKTP